MKNIFALILAGSALTLSIAGCGGNKDSGATTPTLNDALSNKGVVAARESALPQGDSAKPLEAYRPLSSGNEIMFLYYAISAIPMDYEKVAKVYSKEYRDSSDAFRKQDILKAVKPLIDAEVSKAKGNLYLLWQDEGYGTSILSHYDLATKSFSIQSSYITDGASGYMYDNSNYQIEFAKSEQFRTGKVEDEERARTIEKLISSNEKFILKLYAFAQEAVPNTQHVKVQTVHIAITDRHGNTLISM